MKKKIILIFGIPIVLTLICLGLLLYGVSETVSHFPDKKTMEPLNYQAWFSANRKTKKELNYITGNSKDRNIERTVEFSKDELNSYLYMSVNANNAYNYQQQQKFLIEYVNFSGNEFVAYLSLFLDYNTPFGNVVNLKIKFIPEIINDNLELKILDMKVGRYSLPSDVVNYLLRKNKSSIMTNKYVISLLQAVKLFKVENSSVIIKYVPAKLLQLMHNGITS